MSCATHPRPFWDTKEGGDSPRDAAADHAALVRLLALRMIPGLGSVRLRAVLDHFGDAEHVLRVGPSALAAVRGVGSEIAERIVRGRDAALAAAEAELIEAERRGVRIVVRGSSGFPSLLGKLRDAPPLLYVMGELREEDACAVAMVGSRRCTAYGMEQAERFAGVLGRAGLTIVSGGARGIDTAAHRGALRSGGRTVAVLGCGLARAYPPENGGLFERIVAEGRGALVSELPLDTPPNAENFPARNRLISGLSLGVLVVEASRRSGALITARLATEEHGREVMALPGRVDSAASGGSNRLLRLGGASLVLEPADVLETLQASIRVEFADLAERLAGLEAGGTDLLGDSGQDPALGAPECSASAAGVAGPEASAGDRGSVLLASLNGAMTPDELGARAGIDASAVRMELTLLELSGRIERLADGRVRARR